MFTSAKEYLIFFKDIKTKAELLKKGNLPKVKMPESPPLNIWWDYLPIIIGGLISFVFLNVFLAAITSVIYSFLPTLYFTVSVFFLAYSYFFMIIFTLIKQAQFLHQKNDAPFKQVWEHYMHKIACFSRINLLKEKYPYIPAFNKKPIEEEENQEINLTHLSNQQSLEDFTLFIGTSTGLMSGLWHTSALAKDQNVFLDINDAAKNIMVFGGIGSGKTSTIMQPLMLQLMAQGCGGLIFDIKGDVKNTALNFSQNTNRHIRVLGPIQSKLNLLCMIPPEVASSFLKSAFLLHSGDSTDRFWIDTATELSRNVLGLLSFIPKFYTLKDLYLYIFDKEAYFSLEKKLEEVLETLSPEQKRLFKSYHRYKTAIFDQFDEKIKSGVKATLAQALSPFNHPDLTDAFCSEGDLNIEKILDGDIFLVDMPIAKWGLGAKVAYTFIKLRFYNLMQKHHNTENRKLPVFFMCDEFQEIVSCNKDGLSDLNFWDKARSSKTIGIISAQSIASVFAATPNRDYAYALLQNFRNKICLATEDPLTIDYISKLTGKAKTKKKSEHYGHHNSTSISEVRDDVLDAQVFRSLSPKVALALLSINNISRDDALKLYPIYLQDTKNEK